MPVLTFKVTPTEARRIRQLAKSQNATVSAYLRRAALPPETVALELRPHPVSGCLYNAAGGAPVTAKQIKSALADYP